LFIRHLSLREKNNLLSFPIQKHATKMSLLGFTEKIGANGAEALVCGLMLGGYDMLNGAKLDKDLMMRAGISAGSHFVAQPLIRQLLPLLTKFPGALKIIQMNWGTPIASAAIYTAASGFLESDHRQFFGKFLIQLGAATAASTLASPVQSLAGSKTLY
jgi:hypothetical protein